MKSLFVFRLLLFLVFIGIGNTSDLENRIKDIINTEGVEYIKGYMQPFATAFGTSVNGAMYHRAYAKGILRFDAGISAVYLSVPDKGKTFTYNGQAVPTVFGSREASGAVTPGTGVSSTFVPMLQANIGFISNLELTARFIGFKISEFGTISIIGGGVKYGLSDYIPVPMFPLDFSVQAMWHSLSIGDWMSSGNLGMNIQASNGLSVLPIDIYGGVGYESSSIKIKTAEIPDNPDASLGDISITGENNIRATLGIGFTMAVINAHVDYNFGFYNSFGMGLMIVF
jgi:hypothetical protein